MNDYLSKPVRPSELQAALDRWQFAAQVDKQGCPTTVHQRLSAFPTAA